MQLKEKIILKEKTSASIPDKDLVATLKWTSSVDLDLYAYYQTKDGKEGKVYYGSRGKLAQAPYIELDKDSGVGDTGGENEENIRFADLSNLKHVLIVANIYDKPNSSFAPYNGVVSVKHGNDPGSIEVPLLSKEKGSSCVIAHIDNTGVAGPKLFNINKTVVSVPSIEDFLKGNFDTGTSGGRGLFNALLGRS